MDLAFFDCKSLLEVVIFDTVVLGRCLKVNVSSRMERNNNDRMYVRMYETTPNSLGDVRSERCEQADGARTESHNSDAR